jgi:hypothetical protein
LAEVPEEVVVAIEADDRATPTLTGVGRSLVLLGANISYVTRELGIHNPVVDAMVRGILLVGHVVRAASAAQRLLAAAQAFLTTTQVAGTAAAGAQATASAALTTAQVAGTAATGAQAVATAGYTATAAGATAANFSLAASFVALNAALGPVGWALIGIGVLLAGVAGYAAAGGFGGGAGAAGGGMAAVGTGPYQEPYVNINIREANFSTKRDAQDTVKDIGTILYQEIRRYRH